jgi:hypothetical protein
MYLKNGIKEEFTNRMTIKLMLTQRIKSCNQGSPALLKAAIARIIPATKQKDTTANRIHPNTVSRIDIIW